MKIGLDLDNTIFDTEGFYSELPGDARTFQETFEQLYLKNNYSESRHAKILRKKGYKASKSDILRAYKKAPKYVKEREFLQKFCRNNEVYLVTRANYQGWQKKKATEAEILNWFNEIRVVNTDKPKKFKDLDWMIDDNEKEISGQKNGILFDEEESLKSTLSELD